MVRNWLLPFNVNKCKVLHYGRNNNEISYKMNNVVLSEDSSMKDLGVLFNNKLKFDEHIAKITSSANSKLGVIKYVLHNIDKEGFLVLFKSIVRPILEYGSSIWYPYLKKHEKKIETIQRRATRMIRGLDNLSYQDRLRALKLPTLFYRRKRSDLIQVFKIIKKIDKIDTANFFTYDVGITRRNNEFKLYKPRSEKSLKQHSFSHRFINDWNELSNKVTGGNTVNSFKAALEVEWKDKEFKYNFQF